MQSQVDAGEHRGAAARGAAGSTRAVRRAAARPGRGRRARPVARAPPPLLRLVPRQRRPRSRCSAMWSAPGWARSASPGSPPRRSPSWRRWSLEWLRAAGRPPRAAGSGVIQDTASTAGLVALLAPASGRRTTPSPRGLAGRAAPLIVYTSEQGHSRCKGGAARRLRPRQRPRWSTSTPPPTRCDRRRSTPAMARTAPAGGARAPSSPRRARRDDRRRSGRGDRRHRAPSTASGCTSTRRWPARR